MPQKKKNTQRKSKKIITIVAGSVFYALDDETDINGWDYTPNKGERPYYKNLRFFKKNNGFRLPTSEEWLYAAKGGQNFKYAGSDNLDEVGWCGSNSENTTHPVATKKANGYGLYDMSGNVAEWCLEYNGISIEGLNWADEKTSINNSGQYNIMGFRLACNAE